MRLSSSVFVIELYDYRNIAYEYTELTDNNVSKSVEMVSLCVSGIAYTSASLTTVQCLYCIILCIKRTS